MAEAPSIPHRLELRDGGPPSIIAAVANDDRAAMEVEEGRGGGFRGLGVGSVAHHLAHHLEMPLVVVPALDPPLRVSSVVVGLDGSRGAS